MTAREEHTVIDVNEIPQPIRDRAERVLRARPEAIAAVLFGWRARGTSHPGSDWDVAIILADDQLKPDDPGPPDAWPGVQWLFMTTGWLAAQARGGDGIARQVIRDGVVIAGHWDRPKVRDRGLPIRWSRIGSLLGEVRQPALRELAGKPTKLDPVATLAWLAVLTAGIAARERRSATELCAQLDAEPAERNATAAQGLRRIAGALRDAHAALDPATRWEHLNAAERHWCDFHAARGGAARAVIAEHLFETEYGMDRCRSELKTAGLAGTELDRRVDERERLAVAILDHLNGGPIAMPTPKWSAFGAPGTSQIDWMRILVNAERDARRVWMLKDAARDTDDETAFTRLAAAMMSHHDTATRPPAQGAEDRPDHDPPWLRRLARFLSAYDARTIERLDVALIDTELQSLERLVCEGFAAPAPRAAISAALRPRGARLVPAESPRDRREASVRRSVDRRLRGETLAVRQRQVWWGATARLDDEDRKSVEVVHGTPTGEPRVRIRNPGALAAWYRAVHAECLEWTGGQREVAHALADAVMPTRSRMRDTVIDLIGAPGPAPDNTRTAAPRSGQPR